MFNYVLKKPLETCFCICDNAFSKWSRHLKIGYSQIKKKKINSKKLNTLLKPHNSIRIDWWRLQTFLVSIYSLKRMTPTKFCLFDQDTSITLFTINMNKIWTLDPFKTFIFADMTLLGSKVGKGGLEWPINKSLQWKEINI